MEEKLDLDMLALTYIKADIRALEPDLLERKWWDYRLLHPTAATLLFKEEYVKAYKTKFAEVRDIEAAERVVPLRGMQTIESGEGVGLWRARQLADMFGIPYDYFIRFKFDRSDRRGWRFFPRPNQLVDVDAAKDCNDAFQLDLAGMLRKAKHPFFFADQYVGHPQQDAYYEWLCGQVMRRAVPSLSTRNLIFRDRHLPEAVAARWLPPQVIDEARV